MSWFKKVFSSLSSQETKIVCEIPKKDKKGNEDPQISRFKKKKKVKKTLRKAAKKVGLVHGVD